MTPDEFVLEHADVPYNPAKAHEYYIRTRKLKGRKPGVKAPLTGGRQQGTFGGAHHVPIKTPVKSAEQRQKEIEARVEALTARLKQLRIVLARLVDEAKKRSGVEPTKKTSPTKEQKTTKGSEKPLTSTQKADAAKRSKKYYDTHNKSNSLTDKEKSLTESIEKVKAAIQKAEADLRSAVDRARKEVSKPTAATFSRRT